MPSSSKLSQLAERRALWPAAANAAPATLAARALVFGAQTLTDAEALQLAAAITSAEAEALLTEFGSLPEVLAATAADLARHVDREAVARLTLARELGRRVLETPLRDRPVISSWTALEAYLRAVMTGVRREAFHVLFLDRKNQLIADEVMGQGTVDHAPVYPREVVRRALERNASALILAHNHPSGDPTPSSADVDMTKQVVQAARALGIAVHDHVVVGGQKTASFKALGLIS
ncbi:MAG: hypothetical protein A2790_20275 [Phenylobacterium sp. RIFCSPHIGHO2_01_FULL_69_31]|uniref:RadC family protein n=1 Tax=Phenylobacterium sp. RIFCSPHIGHO2_01_FULL_69_31 TaxID=1801944 RepID=UPI0008B1E38B|nr:DNA repair protein RadC [Phenylobacterium sp. RIFCSPHIGHO2_01_FULL_69_31]OHB26299.1 MAG: hypothetical protein A2790_20275 [Phenylobacterium sp. RIFCSPHIGHO2_01_FULL_69_31]